jgi:hypothetical protein
MGAMLENFEVQTSLERVLRAITEASTQLASDRAFAEFLDLARSQMGHLLPDVAAGAFSVGASALTPRDLLRQLELLVAYLGAPVGVSRQSSGVAQLAVFVFALTLAANDPGRILLVDEPEISLHPQSQRALVKALRALESQVLIATHSSNLLDRADPRSILRLRRSAAGAEVACPSTLPDADARRLARFTSPQTAEAFFARSVVLVEGMSDQMAIEALAERRGRNLDAEGIAVVPMGGVKAIGSFVALFGPSGFDLKLAGLCDEGEEKTVARALEGAGLSANIGRGDMEGFGFHVCVADLEEELIRALGASRVEQVVSAEGDLDAFRKFQQQPAHRALPLAEQLHGFISAGRKIEYAPLLVDALDLSRTPRPLDGVLAHV